jgi:pimeloyl-ACP methyl ester carboxylesterase
VFKRAVTSCLEIAYEERGDAQKPAIILLHGFPDDVRTWDGVVEGLVPAGYRTVVPYLRGFGPTRFLDSSTPRSGQLSALTQDAIEFADALSMDRFFLVGHDWGARAAYNIAALWPERVIALVALSVGYGTNVPKQNLSFAQASAYWYQWYFGLEQGRMALARDRRNLCRYLWQTWSPAWTFDDETFETTAKSWDNPDFVQISIHSYRHRWGNADGDPRYDELEERLSDTPKIAVPTTVLHGKDDGATLPETSEGKEHLFSSDYIRRVIPDAGHFLPREKPAEVIKAILKKMKS